MDVDFLNALTVVCPWHAGPAPPLPAASPVRWTACSTRSSFSPALLAWEWLSTSQASSTLRLNMTQYSLSCVCLFCLSSNTLIFFLCVSSSRFCLSQTSCLLWFVLTLILLLEEFSGLLWVLLFHPIWAAALCPTHDNSIHSTVSTLPEGPLVPHLHPEALRWLWRLSRTWRLVVVLLIIHVVVVVFSCVWITWLVWFIPLFSRLSSGPRCSSPLISSSLSSNSWRLLKSTKPPDSIREENLLLIRWSQITRLEANVQILTSPRYRRLSPLELAL